MDALDLRPGVAAVGGTNGGGFLCRRDEADGSRVSSDGGAVTLGSVKGAAARVDIFGTRALRHALTHVDEADALRTTTRLPPSRVITAREGG